MIIHRKTVLIFKAVFVYIIVYIILAFRKDVIPYDLIFLPLIATIIAVKSLMTLCSKQTKKCSIHCL